MSAVLNLDSFRDRFLDRLGERVSVLRGHLAVLACVDDDIDTLETVMIAFHSVAGVAGTYDLTAITDLARRAEALCDAAIEAGAVAPNVLAELHSIVDAFAARQEWCDCRTCTSSPAHASCSRAKRRPGAPRLVATVSSSVLPV